MDGSLKTYLTVNTEGKSQVELVLQVYDGAIKEYRQAIEFIKQEDHLKVRDTLDKAKKFVVHLYTTLDPENGGEVAENLSKLYTYVICQTEVATATKDIQIVDDIVTILGNLRDGWNDLAEQERKKVQKTPPTPVAAESVTANSFVTSG